MKTAALFFSVVCLLLPTLKGQVKVFKPEVIQKHDLSEENLEAFVQRKKAYDELIASDIPFDEMTLEQRNLLEDEMILELGPFGTGPLGCSWYCASGPSGYDASSQLDSSATHSYKPQNVHDFDLRTAWVEGKEDHGKGEEIQIAFDLNPGLKLTHIEIYNGYCKSERLWKANSRVKLMALYIDEELKGHLKLEDSYALQRFEIGSLGGKFKVRLKILDVYPGSKYADTAISEINFDGTGDH